MVCAAHGLPEAGACTVNAQVCECVGEGEPGNSGMARQCGSCSCSQKLLAFEAPTSSPQHPLRASVPSPVPRAPG